MDEQQRQARATLRLVLAGATLAAAVASAVLGAIAPGSVSSVHRLRRTAMSAYLTGCSLLVFGATQVTPAGIGLAGLLLPAAIVVMAAAIGCHLRLRRLGSELVAPEV